LLGIQRPYNVVALRRVAAGSPWCGPVEVGPGVWHFTECFLQTMDSSPYVETRPTILRSDAPTAVDLRAQGLYGPVKDQQQVGVCWAFAVSTVMENAALRQGRAELVAPLHLVATDAFQDLHAKRATDGPMTSEASWSYDPVKACKFVPVHHPCLAEEIS
jgi:C1A family cysteine protease